MQAAAKTPTQSTRERPASIRPAEDAWPVASCRLALIAHMCVCTCACLVQDLGVVPRVWPRSLPQLRQHHPLWYGTTSTAAATIRPGFLRGKCGKENAGDSDQTRTARIELLISRLLSVSCVCVCVCVCVCARRRHACNLVIVAANPPCDGHRVHLGRGAGRPARWCQGGVPSRGREESSDCRV